MPNVLADIRVFLNQIIEGHGDPKHLAQKALEIIDSLIDETAAKHPQRGQPDVRYVVEQSVNGLVLTERRRGGKAFPFRCPEAVYNALIRVLVTSDRPLPLDELTTAVSAETGDAPPDYQIRVPLRLWMHVEPPLVIRNRARYRPVDATVFAAIATDLWNSSKK